MEGIREYLLGVIAAAILCSVISQFAAKDGLLSAGIKLICGVFMVVALVSPIIKIRIDPTRIFSDVSLEANGITETAANASRESVSAIIKEQTQAYILDKANSQGANLSVEVMLSDEEIPKPIRVKITGNVSPYSKRILTQTIENDLGIAAEAQIWN